MSLRNKGWVLPTYCMLRDTDKEGRRMTITLDEHMSNVIAYIADKCLASPTQVIVEAITEYYADEIRELERKEEWRLKTRCKKN